MQLLETIIIINNIRIITRTNLLFEIHCACIIENTDTYFFMMFVSFLASFPFINTTGRAIFVFAAFSFKEKY